MGIYLTIPQDERRKWLADHATEVSYDNWTWDRRQKGQMPLCMITEPYEPVLVCWFKAEMDRALPRLSDYRGRRYFFAPVGKVLEVCASGMRQAMLEDVAGGFIEDPVELHHEEE